MSASKPSLESCPSDGELADFAERKSSGNAPALIEAHVATCAACRERLANLVRVTSETAFAATARSDPTDLSLSKLPTGEQIGRYRIERVLGSGAMGTVYAAYDPDIDRRVALKLIRLETDDPDRRDRVLREAKAMAKVTHPDVITVHDVGAHGDSIFIAMELVEGGTLAEWLAMRRRMPQEILEVFLRAGRALAKAHAVGLVHRDFKPDNVLVGRDGRVRVTDFGLAREERSDAARSLRVNELGVLESKKPSSLSTEGMIVGTPAYMAPEQLRGSRATTQSDIFSFSVALWEALHATRPYVGSTLFALEASIREGRPVPETSPPGLAGLRRALMPGLAPDPSVRCASMEGLISELEKADRPPLAKRLAPPLVALVALLTAAFVQFRAASPRSGGIDKRATVAIMAPSASGDAVDTAWIGTAIAEVAWADLAVDGRVGTLSPDEVARVKRELGVTDADMANPGTLKRMRELVGVDYVMTGSWARKEEGAARRVRLDLRLVRAKDARVLASANESGDAEDLASVTLKAVDALRRRAGIGSSRAEDTTALRASLSHDPMAMQLYARGLERLRALDSRAARDLLTQAVARDPDSARAHSALAQSLSALGREESARTEAQRALDLASTLPRNESLAIEALSRSLSHEWDAAIEITRALCTFYPDDLDYSLRLAELQEKAGHLDDAKRTVSALRALPPPASDDPRVDLADMDVEASRSGYARVLELGDVAASKALASGARGVLGRVRSQQGRAALETGHVDHALAYERDAATLFAAVGDRAAEAKVTETIGTIHADQGDLDAAERAVKAAHDVYAELGADLLASHANIDLAIIRRRRDDLTGARALGERLLAEADATGLAPRERAQAEHNLAIVLFDLGELALAREHLESALATRRAIKYRRGEASTLAELATVLAARGDEDGAERLAREAQDVATQISQKTLVGEASRERGQFALEAGRASDAVALIAPGCDALHEAAALILEAPCRALLARALAAGGTGKDALEQASRAMAMLDTSFAHGVARRDVRTDAALARAVADPSSAVDAASELRDVAREADAAGAVMGRLRAELALGLALIAGHRTPEGRAQLDKVSLDAGRRGMDGIVVQARRALAR